MGLEKSETKIRLFSLFLGVCHHTTERDQTVRIRKGKGYAYFQGRETTFMTSCLFRAHLVPSPFQKGRKPVLADASLEGI